MASFSSSNSAIRRGGPYIPTIACPDCGKMVKRIASGTLGHNGWTLYKYNKHGHGCVFSHWELEYVEYLVDHDYLCGDAAVDAMCWVDERREELKLRQAEREATRDARAGDKKDNLIKNIEALVDVVNKVLLFLKIVLGLLCMLCVLILIILKK